MQNIFFIFLGSLLTFLATVIVEVIKNYRERKDKEKNFKLVAKQEFQSITKNLEKIKTVFEYKDYFEYSTINSLDKSVQELESVKHDAIYLKNVSQQEKFISLTSDISKFAAGIRLTQDLFYNQQKLILEDRLNLSKIKNGKQLRQSLFNSDKENEDAFHQKSIQQFIDLVEINRRLDEIISLFDK